MDLISGYKSSWTILHTYLGLKQNETVLIVTDTLRLKIAKSLYDTAREMNCEAIMMTMPPRSRHGEEPPRAVADAMRSVDVVIAPTTASLTHTNARKRANEAGVRTATMPGVTERMMIEGGLTANPTDIIENTQKLATVLRGASEIRLKSDQGTDITFDVDSAKWNLDVGCCREKGCSTNLPAGELYVAPESSRGTVVIDGSMGGLELLKHPIKIEVKEGLATGIHGDRAKEVLKIINPLGDKARNIAELGIGTNPRARIIGVVLEDEKVCGTAHIALGDNSTIGGNVEAGVHLDAIIRKPRLYADGREVSLL
ncbi:MAG: aminopeptidase [Halobacteriota archaeon]